MSYSFWLIAPAARFFEAVAVDWTMPEAHRYRCRDDTLQIGLAA